MDKPKTALNQLQEILQQPFSGQGSGTPLGFDRAGGNGCEDRPKAQKPSGHFQQALSLGIRDTYLLGAYSDFLLDQNRPAEVQNLLQDEYRSDGLLLRLALAEKRLNGPNLKYHVKNLQTRFAENRLRQDSRHLRNEARFALELLNNSEQGPGTCPTKLGHSTRAMGCSNTSERCSSQSECP